MSYVTLTLVSGGSVRIAFPPIVGPRDASSCRVWSNGQSFDVVGDAATIEALFA